MLEKRKSTGGTKFYIRYLLKSNYQDIFYNHGSKMIFPEGNFCETNMLADPSNREHLAGIINNSVATVTSTNYCNYYMNMYVKIYTSSSCRVTIIACSMCLHINLSIYTCNTPSERNYKIHMYFNELVITLK